jgi:hypothetical protein
MSTERYDVVRSGGGWTVNHDGQLEGDYETKEGAFEAIVVAASNALKDGVGVAITIPERTASESSLGSKSKKNGRTEPPFLASSAHAGCGIRWLGDDRRRG